jgi:CRP-like cAMP-binding protein
MDSPTPNREVATVLERISHEGKTLALLVTMKELDPGINFVTEENSILQMGIMNYPTGHSIQAHVHLPVERGTSGTHEVMCVQEGLVRVDFYSPDGDFVESRNLGKGDWVVLMECGHGFEMLEPSILVEVKNGPYAGDEDKVRFE